MRICSLLPAATEILFAIGAGPDVVGVTHECDYPPEAATRPALLRPRIDVDAEPGEIDRQVRECVEQGKSVYIVDDERLRQANPELIITQDLCHVCAASPDDLASVLAQWDGRPKMLSLTPERLADVWGNIRLLGDVTGLGANAETLAEQLESRVHAVGARMQAANRLRVLCLEWLDPPFVAGHWVPEMVELAGGIPLLARAGVPSVALDWREVLNSAPDVIVLMPCGYGLERTLAEYARAKLPSGWWNLPAVRNGRVTVVDAAYFSRPGPRLAEGTEILARIIHPNLATAPFPPGSCAAPQRADAAGQAGSSPRS